MFIADQQAYFYELNQRFFDCAMRLEPNPFAIACYAVGA